jgi:hypothetical protein
MGNDTRQSPSAFHQPTERIKSWVMVRLGITPKVKRQD